MTGHMTDGLHRVTPPDMFDPTPMGFSPAVVVPAGTALAYVSGQLPHDRTAYFANQVEQVLHALGDTLTAAGSDLAHTVMVTCLVVDLDDDRHAILSAARRRHFTGHLPTSTLIPVPRLVAAGALVEINAVAALPHTPTPAQRP